MCYLLLLIVMIYTTNTSLDVTWNKLKSQTCFKAQFQIT